MLSYILAGVGLALAGASMVVLAKRGLNHQAANAVLLRMAASGLVDRIRKICRAAGTPGTYLDAVDAAVAAGMAAGTRDAAVLAPAVEAAYDETGRTIAAQWKAHAERGLVGVILVGAGLGLAVSDERWPEPLLAMSAVGALVGGFLVLKRGAMLEALVEGRVTVLPALVDALSQGQPAAAEPPVAAEPAPAGALRVRIHRGDAFEREEIVEETVVKIGRNASAQLRLEDDDVSRMHAVIERCDDGAVVLIDLGTSTGTRVNGAPVTKQTLRSGDVIGIGPFRLEVELGGA